MAQSWEHFTCIVAIVSTTDRTIVQRVMAAKFPYTKLVQFEVFNLISLLVSRMKRKTKKKKMKKRKQDKGNVLGNSKCVARVRAFHIGHLIRR